MKKWPHPTTPGPAHFITTTTYKRFPLFKSPVLCKEFFSALTEVKNRFPFELYAYVLMPDHLHIIVRPSDGNISRLMQKVKSLAARKIVDSLKATKKGKLLQSLQRNQSGRKRHTHQIFQQSFRSLLLVNEKLIRQKVDYIHKNPLTAKLAETPEAYLWSSWQAINKGNDDPIPVDPLPW